jgi:hypothetical protein
MSDDIIENLSMASPGDPWHWIRVLGLAVALCVPAGVWFLRLKRAGKLPFHTPPAPPWRSALDRLAAILHLIDEGLVREFVREASDILRGYIEARFGLRAPKLSTEEFLYEAERSERLDADARARLAEFLFGCDRVKFALGNLDRKQMEELHRAAESFIVRSTPPPEAAAKP